MQMEMTNVLCCFLLLVLVSGAFFRLLFVAFSCSSLLLLVFETESVLSQKPKQANAFGCSFWFFKDCITRFGFSLVRKTNTSNKRQKKFKWKPSLIPRQPTTGNELKTIAIMMLLFMNYHIKLCMDNKGLGATPEILCKSETKHIFH